VLATRGERQCAGARLHDEAPSPIRERAGLSYELGEGLSLGIFFHLAETRERAVREITPKPAFTR